MELMSLPRRLASVHFLCIVDQCPHPSANVPQWALLQGKGVVGGSPRESLAPSAPPKRVTVVERPGEGAKAQPTAANRKKSATAKRPVRPHPVLQMERVTNGVRMWLRQGAMQVRFCTQSSCVDVYTAK